MKKFLNTLYITRQDSYLHKERETIVIKNGDEKLGKFPSLSIGNILCFGQISVSPFLMGHCAEQGIGIGFYTPQGRFLARVQGKENGNVLLRRKQYRWTDQAERYTEVSKLIIAAKIANSRSVLLRDLRNHGSNTSLKTAEKKLNACFRRVKESSNLPEIRGIEGEAGSIYFSVFDEMIHNPVFQFNGRKRRPPTDPVNALLSFTYSLITHDCISALYGVGLDPYVGFLHRDRPGRASLALDLIEEFRAAWADRFVLTLINRRQVQPSDFVFEASGATRLKDDARKKLLVAYQERKQTEVLHPYLQEKVPVGLVPHCQSLLLARHMRGDTQYYTPYVVK